MFERVLSFVRWILAHVGTCISQRLSKNDSWFYMKQSKRICKQESQYHCVKNTSLY